MKTDSLRVKGKRDLLMEVDIFKYLPAQMINSLLKFNFPWIWVFCSEWGGDEKKMFASCFASVKQNY